MAIGTAFVKFTGMKKMIVGMAALAFLSSCQQVAGWFGKNSETDSTQTMTSESVNKAKPMRDESITAENSYSDLFLDSAALENYIRKENIPGDKADKMRDFYLVRNNQFAWFTSDGVTEQARGLWSLYATDDKKDKNEPAARMKNRMDSLMTNDSLFMASRDTAARTGKIMYPPAKGAKSAGALTDTASVAANHSAPAPMDSAAGMAFNAADTTLVQTELALTEQFVQIASENNGVVTADNFLWLVPRKKMDALQLADSLLTKQKDSALWQNNTAYTALKNSLQQYYTAAKAGDWPVITSAAGLHKGAKSPAVAALKKRLAATGDYSAGDTTNVFTDSLVTAVKAVQEQYGFKPTGQVTDSLVKELNVPAQQRVQQILVNMNRVLWMPQKQDSNEIMINIPSLELVVYRDTSKVMRMPVIVGKEGTGTMAFRDQISQVVFSPYWNIPQSIVQREIKPAMDKDPAYLKKNNMEIVKQDDSLPQIRQLPGKENALGRVKFLFPNSFDIYLHDTPNRDLFNQKNRALSHGCIRVARPDSLAHYLLRDQPEWTPQKIADAMNSGKEQKVEVKNPAPVVITYYTAWTDKKGKLNFRKDVYGYDQKTATKMFTSTASPA